MWLLIGWVITMIVFVVAIDYTCAQINEVGQRVDDLKEEVRKIDQSVDRCATGDLEMLSQEVEALHKTLTAGLALLLPKATTVDESGFNALFAAVAQVNVAKLLWKGRNEAQDAASAEPRS